MDAVMVGSGTVLVDDPSLSARGVDARRQPARVVVDSSGGIPVEARVFRGAGTEADVLVATTDGAPHDVHLAWKEAGAEVVVLPRGDGGVDLNALAEALGRRGWLEIYCEGGARLAGSFIRSGLVDRLELGWGPVLTGRGPRLEGLGVTTIAEAARWRLCEVAKLEDDVVAVYEPGREGA